MPAAARIGDFQQCPKQDPPPGPGPPIPHIGGSILPPGCPTVLIGGSPAATKGDLCTCTGAMPPLPASISDGSKTVEICGKPAARMGDPTDHGGSIQVGFSSVEIGG